MKTMAWLTISTATLLVTGCPSGDERNAFLRVTEEQGVTTSRGNNGSGSGSGGGLGDTTFRSPMSVTLLNREPTGDLNVAVAAWVNVSSIRSADQQDALLNAGYVQLTREVRLGTAFTLPPGTFVLNGSGTAGSTLYTIRRAAQNGTPTERIVDLGATPDGLLAFFSPPTTCEAPGFVFTDEGYQLEALIVFQEGSDFQRRAYTGSDRYLGVKTLAQFDLYECGSADTGERTFRPGLFLKVGGGQPKANEYFEGQNVAIEFSRGGFEGTDAFAVIAITDAP